MSLVMKNREPPSASEPVLAKGMTKNMARDAEANRKRAALSRAIGKEVRLVSGVSGAGVRDLVNEIAAMLRERRVEEAHAAEPESDWTPGAIRSSPPNASSSKSGPRYWLIPQPDKLLTRGWTRSPMTSSPHKSIASRAFVLSLPVQSRWGGACWRYRHARRKWPGSKPRRRLDKPS